MKEKAFLTIVIIVAILQSSCSEHEKSSAEAQNDLRTWCAQHNKFPIYPGAKNLNLAGDPASDEQDLETTDKTAKVISWYLNEFSKQRWANWHLLREIDNPKGVQAQCYLLKNGTSEISLLISPMSETTTNDHTAISFGTFAGDKNIKWAPVRKTTH